MQDIPIAECQQLKFEFPVVAHNAHTHEIRHREFEESPITDLLHRNGQRRHKAILTGVKNRPRLGSSATKIKWYNIVQLYIKEKCSENQTHDSLNTSHQRMPTIVAFKTGTEFPRNQQTRFVVGWPLAWKQRWLTPCMSFCKPGTNLGSWRPFESRAEFSTNPAPEEQRNKGI